MDRRSFLGTITAASIMSSRMSWAAADDRKLDKIGVQLYTVRELFKKDFEATLAKVAAIGYREVEFAGYPNVPPQQLRHPEKRPLPPADRGRRDESDGQ